MQVLRLWPGTAVCRWAGKQTVSFCAEGGSTVGVPRRPDRTLGRGKCTEAQHRVISLLDPAMILLDAPVQISIAAMVNFRPERFPNRARVRIVPVGGHLDRG
jgi:hypothetical protein